jgi:hypothetical protein
MSDEPKRPSWPWKPWAAAVVLLLASVLAWLEGRVLYFYAGNYRSAGSFILTVSDAAFVGSVVWILILMKPRLWPPKK